MKKPVFFMICMLAFESATADCTPVNKIIQSSNKLFKDIQGEERDSGGFVPKYILPGAREDYCEIDFFENRGKNFAYYQCKWDVGGKVSARDSAKTLIEELENCLGPARYKSIARDSSRATFNLPTKLTKSKLIIKSNPGLGYVEFQIDVQE
ncbi:hypothetical protein [Delftia sp. WSY_14]|uniref:hypothetical protein n=1 Tax=unclassified Delftia TaxID=2613839 RepID=UPI003709E7EA